MFLFCIFLSAIFLSSGRPFVYFAFFVDIRPTFCNRLIAKGL